LSPVARVSLDCRLGINEIYGRVNGSDADLSALAADPSDYKSLIAAATGSTERLTLAQRLATRRLASGVVPELDACFVALALGADAVACDVATAPPLSEPVSWIDPAPHAKR
jgi:hypothetical protein